METSDFETGIGWRGEVEAGVDTPGFRSGLLRMLERSAVPAERPDTRALPVSPDSPPLWVRRYPDADRARRAFHHAGRVRAHGDLTPRPLAWMAREDGMSFLISEEREACHSFREALLHHYYDRPLCRPLIQLLQVCADAVRALHAAGVEHRNLTNDTLRVVPDASGGWASARVSGLEEARFHSGPLPPTARGRDNGGIRLPSDLRRIFQEMQFAPETVPEAFQNAEARRRTRMPTPGTYPGCTRTYPAEPDIWIWDDRSMQAIPALRSRDKRPYYRKRDLGVMAGASLRHGRRIRRAYRDIREQTWSGEVDLDGRIGLSLNLEPHRFDQERHWLEPLGPIPLLVRLYHHESESNRRYAIDAVRKLRAEGHPVTVALVQDRRAVWLPRVWRTFVEEAAGALSGFVEGFEVGHAINRVKWGIWNVPEYRGLVEPFQDWRDRFPQIPLLGPAGIDFEYPRILPMLDQWGEGSLSAFSHHLYVDRRGAPENRQNGYDLLDKLAYARAIARVHPACASERVVVSEVNWPLRDTGVWSPVGSPYQSPGERHNDPSVDEETYADYMRRYLLLSLCSGLADRVYWWNLAAHGFGLVDDRNPSGWRPRPAYHAFRELVEQFRGARFRSREPSEEGWAYRLSRGTTSLRVYT